MNKDFPLDRFNFSLLIQHVKTEASVPNIITEQETGIEFYGADTISKEALIDLLENFNALDNLVQQDSRRKYERQTQLGIKHFQFEPSWVVISPNKIIVGYVGIYINSDFNLTFSNYHNEWILMK